MNKKKLEFGIVGLGRMGGGITLEALGKGMKVVGLDTGKVPGELVRAGMVTAAHYSQVASSLSPPRVIFLYIPAGKMVDKVIDELTSHLDPGDVIADGGNSYWGDSIKRQRGLSRKGFHFIDLGTSGGIEGARRGACFMAGGERDSIELVEPILESLAVPGGYVRTGPPGSGHFAKLVHNGIEFGMLQAIGEGIALMENYRDRLDVVEILRCWRHGSVIRSWLMDLMEEAYRAEGGLDRIPAYVEDTGEVNWLVSDAIHMEVPIPVISQSVMQLLISRDKKEYWARAVAMMRHGFGGHPYGTSEAVARERREGKVGGEFRD